MTKPNSREIYIVADSEAQTAWNDERLSHYVNVVLKKRRAIVQHALTLSNEARLKKLYLRLNKKIETYELKLCNKMNTYLLGYSELGNKRVMNRYNKDVKAVGVKVAQDNWTNKNVKYWYEPSTQKSPWEKMLLNLIERYGKRINDGATSKLIIYFHNLDYDAQNLLQHIMDQDFEYQFTDISLLHNSSLYSLSFKYRGYCFELRDSMKIYNQSLASLGKNVGWQKQTEKATYEFINFEEVDKQKLNDEIYYFKHDIAVLAAVMRHHFKKFKGKSKLTAASYAEADLKKEVKKDDQQNLTNHYKSLFQPHFTDTQEKFIRSAYYGGFVYANHKILNQRVKRGLVGDVNSLYPSVMLNRDYPDWKSLKLLPEWKFKQLELNDYNLFIIIRIKVTSLQMYDDGVPCIPKKAAFGLSREVYSYDEIKEDPVLTLTNLDLYWIEKNYQITFNYLTGVIATSYMHRPFSSFILKHKKEKEKAVAEGNHVNKMIAKIHLNSTYGKFAQRKIMTKSVLIQNKDGTVGFSEQDDPHARPKQHNILVAVFITAFARDVLLSMIDIVRYEKDAHFWYCDTDAVHFGYSGKLDIVKDDEQIFKDCKIPFSPNVFGLWKPEQHMREAVYLGSKRYWEQDPVAEQKFIKRCQENNINYSKLDVRSAGAIIKGAGIQKQGKEFLVKQGINNFAYRKQALIVPYRVSKKVISGVKIFDSIKLIQPTPYQYKFILFNS